MQESTRSFLIGFLIGALFVSAVVLAYTALTVHNVFNPPIPCDYGIGENIGDSIGKNIGEILPAP